MAATRHDLAAAASGQGHTDEEEAKAKGVTSLAVAQTLHNRALASWSQGNYSEAEGLYKRALATREQALGANHPDVAQTLHNLGLVHGAQRKNSEAEELYKRALAIREKTLGASHLDVAWTLNNLAVNRRRIGTPDRHPKGTPSFYVLND